MFTDSTKNESQLAAATLFTNEPDEDALRQPDLEMMGSAGNTPGAFATNPYGDFQYVTSSPTQGIGGSVDALMAGSKWTSTDGGTTIVTYSFATSAASTYAYQSDQSFTATITPFSEADKATTRTILHNIEAVANVQFVEVPDNDGECGVVRYAYSTQPNAMNYAGYAFYPSSTAQGGDVWIGTNQATSTWDFYRPDLILHETLHAMGLKHPFDTSGVTLSTAQNIIPNTVMSYSTVAGGSSGYMSKYPTEPMPLDIAALQYLYGAAQTNTGDTTYDLSSSEFQGFNAIWDAGGTDTLDASKLGRGVTLDLHSGAQSDIGSVITAQAKAATGSMISTSYGSTLSIASGAMIENANGTAYADRLTGNDATNVINAGGGNDRIDGAGGSDWLDGGSGIDTDVASGARAQYSIAKTASGFQVAGPDGVDQLSNIERIQFADMKWALDIDGNAGTVAKILGAVIAPWAVHSAQWMGIGMSALDNGMSVPDLVHAALDARLGAGASSSDVATLLLQNLTGEPAYAGAVHQFAGLIDSGAYTATSLAMAAMDSSFNLDNVDLVGLAHTGVEYA